MKPFFTRRRRSDRERLRIMVDTNPTGPLPDSTPRSLIRELSMDLPPARGTQNELSIRVEGHFDGSYSLSIVNRRLTLGLSSQPSASVVIVPRETIQKNGLSDVALRDRRRLEPLMDDSDHSRDVAIYHHYPMITGIDPTLGTPVLLFFWEETVVPEEMIETINGEYQAVLVASWVVRKALIDSGCVRPIFVIPIPIESIGEVGPAVSAKDPFVFLHVSSCFPRKGVDVLMVAFDRLLEVQPDAELVIKTFPNPHNQISELLERLVRPEHRDRIRIIDDYFTDDQMATLYRSSNAMVLPSRGEGLNLPAIEAILHGLPVVTTGYGAHTDYLSGDASFLVNYRFSRADSHVSTRGSVWANPDAEDLVRQCGNVIHASHETGGINVEPSRQAIQDRFVGEAVAVKILDTLRFIAGDALPRPRKLSMITFMTTWDEACGIAEYTKHIVLPLLQDGVSVSILAPSYYKKGNSDMAFLDTESVRPIWQREYPVPPQELSSSPDPIWLQYHPGFYPLSNGYREAIRNATRRYFLRIITLHSTQEFLFQPESSRRFTSETLNEFYRVVVHTIDDLNVLKTLGVTDNVTLLPHGVSRRDIKPPARSRGLTVGSFGFLFPHKNIHALIDSFRLYLDKLADEENEARLILVNSVHPSPVSQEYKQLCDQRIRKNNLQEKVDFFSEFVSEKQLVELLSQCDVVVLPYGDTTESASGAVRTALSICPSVAVTPARIFDDVRDSVFTLRGSGTGAITTFLEQFHKGSYTDMYQDIHKNRESWLADHDWNRLAERHKQLVNAGLADLEIIERIASERKTYT